MMPGNRGACFIIWVTTEETAAPQCGCTQLNDKWGSTSLVSRSDEHCDDVVALPSAASTRNRLKKRWHSVAFEPVYAAFKSK